MKSLLCALLVQQLALGADADAKLPWNRTVFPRIGANATTGARRPAGSGLVGRSCLQNADECMEEDFFYETTSSRLANFLFATAPPFDLSRMDKVSPMCREQSEAYLEDLRRFKLWALKMYDSSAKLPSGILNGNVNQLGDFDLCLQVKDDGREIEGKYCLASMQVESGTSSPYIVALHTLAQSHFHFKSQLDDPGHRVPRYSSINWAICVPSGCSAADVEQGLKRNVNKITRGTDLKVRVRVDPQMCRSAGDGEIPTSTIVAIWFFAGIALLTVVAAVYDYNAGEAKNRWLMAFSLRKNFDSLISLKKSHDDIEAIHGIRLLNALLLVLAHKSMAAFFVPYVNRTEMIEILSRPFTVIARAASLYTDPFILISGTLTAYSILGKLQKRQKINLVEEYASRLFRIVPTFAALIAFCTLVLPWLNSGPLWNLVVSEHSDICKKYWWRNLLFIHNYFGFKDMCLTHTHHIGIDTQLFFVSPFLILLLWKWPKKGAYTLLFLALGSTVMRYYVTYTMKLSNYIHFGTSVKQLFQTADNMYILPVHRATVYIMGIFLGYILRNCRNVPLTKSQLRAGNALAIFSLLTAFLGPSFMGRIDYIYNPTDAAWYAAFAPILWCLAFAWIIFTSHIGYRGVFDRIFSWHPFSLWTKISYTVYLTQFPIFFYNVGVVRTSEHYGLFKVLLNVKELIWIVALSVVLTLLFEMPFQNVRNLIFKKGTKRKSS